LLIFAWLACALVIAVWVVGVTGIDAPQRVGLGLATLICLGPVGVVVALDEFVIRRIRYGPPVPGRRKRDLSGPGPGA
jgi:hypothetical protein